MTGKRITMEYLNTFVSDEFQINDFAYKSKLTLSNAKENILNGMKKEL